MCDKKKSLKQVKKILEELVDYYNDRVKKNFYLGDSISIDNFIVRIYTKKEYDKKHKDYAWNYESEKNIGKIIIEGTCDNIIPYELFDIIENLFNADREHLG